MKFMSVMFVLFSVLVSGLASGCAVVSSSDVNPSAIYSQYSASYDQASNTTSFTAEFFVGGDTGTYVELDSKSSVLLDSNAMQESKNIFNQVVYQAEQNPSADSLGQAHVFAYTDDSGSVYRNSVQIPGAISFTSSQPNTASINGGFSVLWQASQVVGPNETIRAALSGSNGSAIQYGYSGGTSGQLSFDSESLQSLKPGPATVTLCRDNYTTDIEGSSSGGSLTASYCATPFTVTVVP